MTAQIGAARRATVDPEVRDVDSLALLRAVFEEVTAEPRRAPDEVVAAVAAVADRVAASCRDCGDVPHAGPRCLGCGASVGASYFANGSLRCGECRSAGRPLSRELVEAWAGAGAQI